MFARGYLFLVSILYRNVFLISFGLPIWYYCLFYAQTLLYRIVYISNTITSLQILDTTNITYQILIYEFESTDECVLLA